MSFADEYDRSLTDTDDPGVLLARARHTRITWRESADVSHPWRACHEGRSWRLRVVEYPLPGLYTLIIDGREIGIVETWPDAWARR